MPITAPTKQPSLSILTLQENVGGTLSNQITGIGRFITWGGKKLMGLVHTPNAHTHTTFAKTSSCKNSEASPANNDHDISPADINQQDPSPAENPSHSLSKEAMASRIIASATVGLFLGGLPGALACSGATFTGIQIKRTLASQDDKLLPTLALIALNLAAVILPDAEEISTAYSDGRYADALTTFITKAPANLLLGAILKTFIQSNIENITNHCLPEFAKPKNNELTSAAFNGVSDALALHASPILRREIATFCSNHLPRFPLASAHAIPSLNDTSIDIYGSGDNSTSLSLSPTSTYSQAMSLTSITTSSFIEDSSISISIDGSPTPTPFHHYPMLVYSANITDDAIVSGVSALKIGKDLAYWDYPKAWIPKSGCLSYHLTPNISHEISFDYFYSRKLQATLTLNPNCPPDEVEYRIQWNQDEFLFSAEEAAIYNYNKKGHHKGHHKWMNEIHFLLLSEEKSNTFQITFSPTDNHTCISALESCTVYDTVSPYKLKISSTEIQYYFDPYNNLTTPTTPTYPPTFAPDYTINHIFLGIFGGASAIFIVGLCIFICPLAVNKIKQIKQNRDNSPNESSPLINHTE